VAGIVASIWLLLIVIIQQKDVIVGSNATYHIRLSVSEGQCLPLPFLWFFVWSSIMFGNIKFQDYKKKRELKININASWVRIESGPNLIFKREPQNDDWYDAKHEAIVKAVDELEKALLNAANSG
jgi:hypothetical protein